MIDVLQKYISRNTVTIEPLPFALDFILVVILSTALQLLYVKFGTSLSNRSRFARNFVFLAATTMMMIAIIKSSLALSLGLVGALTIIRFRSAIKEPEEITYIFVCIALGLGMGSGQRVITLVFFLLLAGYILLRNRVLKIKRFSNTSSESGYLTISSQVKSKIHIKSVSKVLDSENMENSLKRSDTSNKEINLMFALHGGDSKKIQTIVNALKKLDSKASVTYLHNEER